jgi:hypothetical protein
VSDHVTNVDRVLDLAGAICDERASHADFDELDSIVVADQTSRRCYWGYCWMHVALGMEARVHRTLQKVREREGLDSTALTAWEADTLRAMMPPAAPALSSPALSFPSTILHGTFSYFSSSWPVAYLAATVICGIGLLIGSLVHVYQPVQVVRQSSVPSRVNAEPKTELVGRITGMVDCQWKNDECRMMNDELPAHKNSIHPSSVNSRLSRRQVCVGCRAGGNHLR